MKTRKYLQRALRYYAQERLYIIILILLLALTALVSMAMPHMKHYKFTFGVSLC